MKPTVFTLPKYCECEYLLVLKPDEFIAKEISNLQVEFTKKYNIISTCDMPDIVLASFCQHPMAEIRLIRRLKTIALEYYPFKVELNSFGSVADHTIYISIISKTPIQELIKKIRKEIHLLIKSNEKKAFFNIKPFITIAKDLQVGQYNRAWPEYSSMPFTGGFIANEMLLLRRHQTENSWQIINRFEFKNLSIEMIQGELY